MSHIRRRPETPIFGRTLQCALMLGTAMLLAFAGATASAKEELKREFKTSNFSWTLPSSDWSFAKITDNSHKQAGGIIQVTSDDRHVRADVTINDSGGLELDERLAEVKEGSRSLIETITHTKIIDSSLSGIKGKALLMQGHARGGKVVIHFRGYLIERKGKFYHLNIICYHGSHRRMTESIDRMRRGFRLLKGAGKGEDAPETFDELPKVDTGSAESGKDAKGGGGDDIDWPEKGPKRDGSTAIFPKHNLRWTLPSGGVLKWDSPMPDASVEPSEKTQALIRVVGEIERKKQEFEKNTPDKNNFSCTLLAELAPPGRNTAKALRSQQIQDNISKAIFDGKHEASKTQVRDTKIGNWKGTYAKFVGRTKRGLHHTFLYMETMLQGVMYTWQVNFVGHSDAQKSFGKLFGKLIKGVKFESTDEWIAGPLKGVVAEFPGNRGNDRSKATVIDKAPGITFKKPPGVAELSFRSSFNRAFCFAVEGRSEDNKNYFYMDVHSNWMPSIQQSGKLEDFIVKRHTEWKAAGGDPQKLPKTPFRKGKFGAAKGFQYEYEGTLNDEPFVEQGYAVKHKQTAYFIRVQFGGENAEKNLKNLWKSIKKGFKFRKLNDGERRRFNAEIPRTR